MRAHEFLEAETVTDYARDIDREFRRLGYKKLGSGADAKVWAADENFVIKVLMPEDETSRAGEVFRKFYEFCLQHQDVKCLPKINEYNTIDVLGKEYTQIDMERLIPLQRRSFEEGVVWFFSDFIAGQHTWDQTDYALGLADTWQDYNKRMSTALADHWQNISMSGSQEYKDLQTLYKVMGLLYKTGIINKYGWDLHTENVMKRQDGTLVIIDPWFNMNEKSV